MAICMNADQKEVTIVEKTKTKDVNMLEGNLLVKIILFALPVMFSSVLQLLFNAADLVVVGQFAGDDSMAAISSTGALVNLITNFFIGISVGANVAVANAIGAKNQKAQHLLTQTAIVFSVIAGAILTVFGIFTVRFWLELMSTTPESIDKATLYLQIYFGGMIFNMLYNFGASVLRAVGETKKPLYYLLIAGVVNVILNLITVILFKMDVAGVGIATVASQAISAGLVLRHLMKRNGSVSFDIRKIFIDLPSLGQMVLIGLPAGIQGCIFSASNVIIQTSVNSFGSNAIVAGSGASASVEGFVYVSMNAFYQACITFTGQNFGARKIKNCQKVLIDSELCVIVMGLVLGFLCWLFARELVSLYTKEGVEYGVERITIICLSYALCGMMDVLVGFLRGFGKSIVPMVVSILGVCGVRIVWIFTIFQRVHTLKVLFLSYPISWIFTALVHFVCFLVLYRKMRKKYPEH